MIRAFAVATALMVPALFAGTADAAYQQRFSTIANGGLTFTGNTIGLNKASNANAPGTAGAIGTFITTNTALVDGTYPAGTTANWALNSSSAILTIPPGSTILYAELIWSGSYSYGGENVSASLNNAVTFNTPFGSSAVSPAAATAQTLGVAGTGGAAGTCTTTPCYYVRSADVTAIVTSAGAGTYTVGGIPATQGNSENNANTGGWTLAVAYRNGSLPSRNLTIFVGAENAGSPAATVSGFCTPPTGPRSGRLLVSAIEGDPSIAGDQMLFGPSTVTATAVSGPNNPAGNFFASQINGDNGALNTTGSFGTSNSPTGGATSGARQGYDITNVDVSATLANNQTTAVAQGTTTGDQYTINALGLQINVGSPSFLITTKTVDKAVAVVGDTLTYTVALNNTGGTADANNVVFTDAPPPGTAFVAGSVTVDGVANAGVPSAGINVGTVVAGGTKTVTFKVTVTSIPAAPATAVYSNAATWAYQFISCAGQPTSSGTVTTSPVLTNIARLAMTKTVTPTGLVNPGTVLTYTVVMTNDGTAASSGSTLADPIPAGTTYVAGSTTLNGTAVADVAGVMRYATAGTVNSPTQAAGIIAVAASATVSFKVTVGNNALSPLTNVAAGDIDGAGLAPNQTASASNAVPLIVNLSVAKTNNTTSVTAGAPTVYRIVVSNAGPGAADNSVFTDPAVAGLTCTTVTCVSAALTGAATCPIAASVTIANLQGAGIVLTTLPAASSIAFDVACTVTATGS
jgi:large repetitive protein